MAKQAIERTLEKAQRGLPASSFTRGELARKDESRRCAPPAVRYDTPAVRGASPAIAALPARTRPTRMCLGCRERAAQGDLIRIFSHHSDSSSHHVDSSRTGEPSTDLSTREMSWLIVPPLQKDERPVSRHGRSAYVHNSPSCFKSACIAQRLQRAFREPVSMERARELMAVLEAIEAPGRVIHGNVSKKTNPSKNADLQCRGGEASTQTEQIKREAKK